MTTALRWWWVPVLVSLASPARSQHHHGSAVMVSHGGHGYHPGGGFGPVVVGGHHAGGGFGPGVVGGYPHSGFGPGFGSFGNFGYGLGAANYGYGYGIPYAYPTPPTIVAVPVAVPQGGGGLMLPPPPAGFFADHQPAPRRANPERAKEQVLIGDRSFRGGNIKRAEDKYLLAAKADPSAPLPHVHLAQVSLARGDYAAAADRLRDAVTVAGATGWLLNTPDIQAIFAEPADFARQLGKLESHLQAHPGDRDAWFVLGVEYYLSGRSKPASDVFQRLTDRKPDEALSAFLDATNTRTPAAN